MSYSLLFFFFDDTATTEIYTLSLHDALPISDGEVFAERRVERAVGRQQEVVEPGGARPFAERREMRPDLRTVLVPHRSEEHTSELQSHVNLVCRLLLEKKKKKHI